ncbi:MAG: DNA polymerase I [Alphaproteobacteria bacterium]|nr:DNA polymerase I [Alphaproteobacteria bacterium]MBN2779907.1 DNA polymerase I [Alphaproteobacteria bacterium]
MAEKFFLIDGYSFIFRAFYGIPLMFRSDGTPVNAIFGFCTMLLRLIEQKKHGRYAVILDAPGKTFRNDLYSAYKENRSAPPDEMIPQFDILRDTIKAFGLPLLEKEGFEADDLIATYAAQAKAAGHTLEIVSSDKDLMQLVTDDIFMYDSMKDKFYYPKDVVEKMGVPPSQIIDYQAIVGDSSDNVPGVKGIGPKGAAALLTEYGTLDGIYENVEKITQKGIKEKLIQYKDTAYLSKKLVTLDQNVPDIPSLEDIKPAEINLDSLQTFFEIQEFKRLMPRLKLLGQNGDSVVPPLTFLKTEAQQERFLRQIFDSGEVAFLINDVAIGLAVSNAIGVFPLKATTTDLFAEPSENTLPPMLKDLLENGLIKKIVWDLKDILKEFPNAKKMTCLQTMAYDLFGSEKNNLKDLSAHFNIELPPLFQSAYDKDGYEAFQIWAIYKHLLPLMREDIEAKKLYDDIDFPLIPVLTEMEQNGITLDVPLLDTIEADLTGKISALETDIFKTIPEDLNLDSPKQLGTFLFEKLGLTYKGRKTASGQYSTDSSKLKDYLEVHPVIQPLLNRRELVKLQTTYVQGLRDSLSNDGRIHTTYLQNHVNTGRLSSRNPNLQNIPIRTETGRQFRKLFIPQKGWDLIASDYSQIELRVMAHLANVKNLIEAFNNHRDIHTETASKIFDIDNDSVSASQRRKAKIINFSMIYGASPYGLADNLEVDIDTAKSFMQAYFNLYPEIKHYMAEKQDEAKTKGFVKTLFGRKCPIALTHGRDANFTMRVAVNAPVQGTSADIMRLAMIKVSDRLKKDQFETKILLQIHDEIILESPKHETQKVIKLLREEMEHIIQLSVPLKVDTNVGDNWDEAH